LSDFKLRIPSRPMAGLDKDNRRRSRLRPEAVMKILDFE
jgi:hypothetical protein